jgi:hypothetical integral membrane protein (TIGR02206 family)
MIADLVPMRFQSFSDQHFGLLALFVVVFVALVVHGRQHGDNERFRRGFAVAILCFTIPLQTLQLLPDDFNIGTSLPLQYCDLAWMTAVYALWTRAWWAIALTFYWALTLTTQAIITPSLGQEFPEPRFFMYWGMHFLSVWAAGWLAASGGTPNWRGYRLAVVVTAVWAAMVMGFNEATGTNYGYLNRKPPSASILDLMPEWPYYVMIEIALVAGVWALITWPFARASAPAGAEDQPAR